MANTQLNHRGEKLEIQVNSKIPVDMSKGSPPLDTCNASIQELLSFWFIRPKFGGVRRLSF